MNFPATRLRRLRENRFMRRLCAEVRLDVRDLIYPVFVHAGENSREIATLPGVECHSLDSLLHLAELCQRRGLTVLALFPAIEPQLRDAQATESLNPDGLIPRCVQAIRQRFPDITLIADVALDPYTAHGHDGVLDEQQRVDNDRTIDILRRQSLMLVESGCHALAPSDMMDGRIGVIRQALEKQRWHHIPLIAYSAKYGSAFYHPFRDAIGAAAQLGEDGKLGYQIDPACARQAMLEGELDAAEGADVLMVKPAMPYLDIIAAYRKTFHLPIFAYQVSGEYAMLKWSAHHGSGDCLAMAYESLLSIKRAGADAIVTYFALELVASGMCQSEEIE